jgi:hypothetical protein
MPLKIRGSGIADGREVIALVEVRGMRKELE